MKTFRENIEASVLDLHHFLPAPETTKKLSALYLLAAVWAGVVVGVNMHQPPSRTVLVCKGFGK